MLVFSTLFLFLFYLFSDATQVPDWPPNYVLTGKEHFHYIVVGAGSTGATIASRLSDWPELNVLLLEAGGDPPLDSVIPGRGSYIYGSIHDWNYKSERGHNASLAQQTPGVITSPRGKMLGGTSSLNFMEFMCGCPADYDGWAETGFTSYKYRIVVDYIKKLQSLRSAELLLDFDYYSRFHTIAGPVTVTQAKRTSFIEEDKLETFIQAFEDVGHPTILDYNTDNPFGMSKVYYTHSIGPHATRSSTAQAYLVPRSDRENLFVVKNALVSKVIIDDNNTATGVEFIIDGDDEVKRAYATNEVIVSAGAFNSPKILVASGIGSEETINNLGIKQIANLPVGENLQDHPNIQLFFSGAKDLNAVNLTVSDDVSPVALMNGFFSLKNFNKPEYQVLGTYHPISGTSLTEFCKFFGYNNDVCTSVQDVNKEREIFQVTLMLLHPQSKGKVEIISLNPYEKPKVHYDLLANYNDIVSFKQGIEEMLNLVNSRYLKQAKTELIRPVLPECDKLEYASDPYWECYIRHMVVTTNHSGGTCSMGDVVDEHLKVYGVKKLRVADTSVFPTIPSGNTNCPAMAIGEKICDNIKGGLIHY